jgi:hypothetical protein
MEELDPAVMMSTLRLTRDMREAARRFSPEQQRLMVDMYYMVQENRKRAANQVLAMKQEPNLWITWLTELMTKTEKVIAGALDISTNQLAVSKWAKSCIGIGPVIAAGLAAYIDITRTPSISALWSLAGQNPTAVWERGQKRPWNASLKRLCWLIGESFCRFHRHERCIHGHIYARRKGREVEGNDSGRFSELASKTLADRAMKDADTRAWYEGRYPAGTTAAVIPLDSAGRDAYLRRVKLAPGEGQPMLPLGRLELRARRVAVKLFLGHYYQVACYEHFHKLPAKPYIQAAQPDLHTHYIPPPGYEDIFVWP